jgi:hypothetical protein
MLDSQTAARFARGLFAALGVGMRKASIFWINIAASLLAWSNAIAQLEPRFADRKINRREWTRLYEEAKQLDGADISIRQLQTVIEVTKFQDFPGSNDWLSVSTTYVFTLPGHPAHPAVVVYVAQLGPSTHVAQREAYYAGRHSAFEDWLHGFRFNEYEMYIPK